MAKRKKKEAWRRRRKKRLQRQSQFPDIDEKLSPITPGQWFLCTPKSAFKIFLSENKKDMWSRDATRTELAWLRDQANGNLSNHRDWVPCPEHLLEDLEHVDLENMGS